MAVLDPLKPPAESALQICLMRLIEAVDEENTVLRRNRVVSHAGFASRKNHALREIMAIARAGGVDAASPVYQPLVRRVSMVLDENSKLLKLHIAAISAVSDIIVDNLKRAESDGTYSRHLLPSRD